jgi:CheY-like chemotaxis protein
MNARTPSAQASKALGQTGQQSERHATRHVCPEALVPHTDWSVMGTSDHFVQLYEEDAALLDAVSCFTHTGLQAREAAVIVATRSHRHQLEARLSAQGIDLTLVHKQGQYIALDAAETLASIVINGCPDTRCFGDVIGGIVAQANSRYARVRVFGDMVALLWAGGNGGAALRLEKLWNDLAAHHIFRLFCAYPMRVFPRAGNSEQFLQMCAEHSHVIPAESYTALVSADERRRTIVHLQQQGHALASESAVRQPPPLAEPTRAPIVYGQTILIVDDEPGIVRALTLLLRRDGHTVETAINGRLALEKCQEQNYDMVLCDLHMPELDGPGFYRELQRRGSPLCRRVLFVTGDMLAPEARAFLDQTALPHLNKPFTAAMLRQALLANMANLDRL